MAHRLYYIYDPMCSWCWGFRPTLQILLQQLPKNLSVQYVLGGLAPDSNEPMPAAIQAYIKKTWQKIQQVIPETKFNFNFWDQCQPRRSTYPACRAVLAAKLQGPEFEVPMLEAIQKAYYLQAQNPSDDEVLVEAAGTIGLDKALFFSALNSLEVHRQLKEELLLSQTLFMNSGGSGFPSLVLAMKENYMVVPRDYTQPKVALDFIQQQTGNQ